MKFLFIIFSLILPSALLAFDATEFKIWESRRDVKGDPVAKIEKDKGPGDFIVKLPIYDTTTGELLSSAPYEFNREELLAERDTLTQKISDINHLLTKMDDLDSASQAVTP